MRRMLPRPLLAVSLFMAFALLPSAVHAQRGLNTNHTPPPHTPGRFHALVIGNNAYTSLPRLKTAEADARAVAALLRESYGFETKLLLDATRQQIVSALYAYRQTLGPGSNLLIYYAGHGFKDPEEQKAYWLPVDAVRDDPSNWIMADEVTTRIKVMPARHVIVVSDSCYSGTLMRGIGEAPPAAGERAQFLQRMMAGRSRTLMASGGDEPVADGGGGNHSVFANALLRGLREIDKDGFTAAELFRYHVEESVGGRAQQMPEYQALRSSGHESGDFVFVRVRSNDKRTEATHDGPPPVETLVMESEHWNAIKDGGGMDEYQGFLKKYPDGQYALEARRRSASTSEGDGKDNGAETVSASDAATLNTVGGARSPSAEGSRQSGGAGKTAARARVPDTHGGRMGQPQIARDGEQYAVRGESVRGRRP